MALEQRYSENEVSNINLIYVLPSVKNKHLDSNSITEQTGLYNFLLQPWPK
jgi:hypothetical protein